MRWANDTILEEALTNSRKFVVAAFLQYQSEPCRHFIPEFFGLEEILKGTVEFFAIEVTENPLIADACEVDAVPTTVVFLRGQELGRFEGPYEKEALKSRISGLMAEERKKEAP